MHFTSWIKVAIAAFCWSDFISSGLEGDSRSSRMTTSLFSLSVSRFAMMRSTSGRSSGRSAFASSTVNSLVYCGEDAIDLQAHAFPDFAEQRDVVRVSRHARGDLTSNRPSEEIEIAYNIE